MHKAPEIQQMYSLNIPVSEIRTKVRQEFERRRYVNQLPVVDMLLFKSHEEYQVQADSKQQLSLDPLWATSSRGKSGTTADTSVTIGDHELLETTTTRPQVL